MRTLIANREIYFNQDLFDKYRSQNISLASAEGIENVPNQDLQAPSIPGATASTRDGTIQTPGCISLSDIYPRLGRDAVFTEPTRHRRFFMSYKKYMGLAPPESKAGDFVCVLFGCRLPVMLRQIDDHWIFLGAVYFHGWMDGRALSLLDSGQLHEQDFEIH